MSKTTEDKSPKLSIQHMNGDQCVAIDIETTGLDSCWHEIIQIAMVPLDANFRVRQDVLPFYINMMCESPERVSEEALRINGKKMSKITTQGHDREAAREMLIEWVEKLGLPMSSNGFPKRIVPLGHNYAFDMGFIKSWLGEETYNFHFNHHYRDTMITANYLNDQAATHAEVVPFSYVKLTWLCKKMNVLNDRAHDALSDAAATAEVYRKMCQYGLM